jgi:hypothetical protein
MNGGAGRCNPDVTKAKQRNYLLTDTVINALHRTQFDVGDGLRRGTAETEQKARIDALQVGMTYIDRAKGRSSPGDARLH